MGPSGEPAWTPWCSRPAGRAAVPYAAVIMAPSTRRSNRSSRVLWKLRARRLAVVLALAWLAGAAYLAKQAHSDVVDGRRALQDVRVLTAEQVRLSAAADTAAAEAAAATRRIQADNSALGKVVSAQRARVDELRKLVSRRHRP